MKHEFVVCGIGRFKQEHLDKGSRLLAEVHAGLDNLGVVEHHQGTLRQVARQIVERVFAHLAMTVDEQLAVVALGERKLGYALIGERIVIVADLYVFCIHCR